MSILIISVLVLSVMNHYNYKKTVNPTLIKSLGILLIIVMAIGFYLLFDMYIQLEEN
ncbi:hypothetical protein [Abyssalbus ytuae]|uniref:Uncharacterized protein n=1 Tax=Abyssalbus ytuae TaxID=2926907 RepID=A0A9E6ZPX1_9FLAO|nr:hypothetical protein [Abyssalbus ytuae]UOB16608.1 hypothetical protein MQE35_12785 [Abyssalbus ytuae]